MPIVMLEMKVFVGGGWKLEVNAIKYNVSLFVNWKDSQNKRKPGGS